MKDVQLIDIWVYYSKGEPVLKGLELEIEKGELIALLGASGCGKTTTLKVIAGFVIPQKGKVMIGGRDFTHIPAHKRNIGIVFQSYALFPHMNVKENILYGLRIRGVDKGEAERRFEEIVEMLGIKGLEDRYPSQLSGGQQQRVALARAIAIQPDILLMDEPLSNVDPKFRSKIRFEIKRIQKQLGITTIYVTHDQEDALEIADRVAVMNNGIIEQIAEPSEIYERPKTAYIADFLGFENVFPVDSIEEPYVVVKGTRLKVKELKYDSKYVAIRSTKLSISKEPLPNLENIGGKIITKSFKGDRVRYILSTSIGELSVLANELNFHVGEDVYAHYKPDDLLLLSR
ncbi:MAG: ABC transporter ATP-binding protein [Nitrososphaerota archaeon]|nr:ABC transporter ATP-binding protein [Nitrososphaerales archaeon]MDW8045036.1 ABC transporter ATP-binding protein [Nitrososphaerota archaeon]